MKIAYERVSRPKWHSMTIIKFRSWNKTQVQNIQYLCKWFKNILLFMLPLWLLHTLIAQILRRNMGQSSSQTIDLTSEHSSETEFNLSDFIEDDNWKGIKNYFLYSEDTKKKKRKILLEDDCFHRLVSNAVANDDDDLAAIEILELVMGNRHYKLSFVLYT